MKNKITLSVIGLVSMLAVSAQNVPVDYNQLANNCQLVVEKNNLKNQKQQELADLTAELENYKQIWWDICYDAMADSNTTKEEIQYLLENTYPDIDNKKLITDLNNSLEGRPVTRQEMPQQPRSENNKKTDKSKSQPIPQPEPPVKEEPKKEFKDETGSDPHPELTEPTKMDPTKKTNEADKTVIPEKKEEDKTKLRPDELVKQRKKHNKN